MTLYVTDLDGTLLRSDRTVSRFTAATLTGLMDDGVPITCATARSWVTAGRMLGDLRFRLPVILYNGTFTYDAERDRLLDQHLLPERTVQLIIECCREVEVPPLLYWVDGTREQVSWVSGDRTEVMDRFWADRPADPRNSPRESWAGLPTRGVFTIAAIGEPDSMLALAVRDAATGIIASNDEDGVAGWLMNNVR